MITASELYWLTRLDSIKSLLSYVICFILVLTATSLLGYMFINDCNDKSDRKYWSWLLAKFQISAVVIITIMMIINVFIPTTKEMAAIKVIPMIATSQTADKLGDIGNNMLDLADEWVKELKPKNINKTK